MVSPLGVGREVSVLVLLLVSETSRDYTITPLRGPASLMM